MPIPVSLTSMIAQPSRAMSASEMLPVEGVYRWSPFQQGEIQVSERLLDLLFRTSGLNDVPHSKVIVCQRVDTNLLTIVSDRAIHTVQKPISIKWMLQDIAGGLRVPQYYQAGTSHYNVRAYDDQANQLVPGSIADKTRLDEKMQGAFLTRQLSNDGDMAYTLYINTVTNDAFIHILWLTDTIDNSVPFPMIARCVDLPVGNAAALLRYYTLTLSQDGKTLYAVDPATGITLLNSSTGQTRSVIQGSVQAPWGVAWEC